MNHSRQYEYAWTLDDSDAGARLGLLFAMAGRYGCFDYRRFVSIKTRCTAVVCVNFENWGETSMDDALFRSTLEFAIWRKLFCHLVHSAPEFSWNINDLQQRTGLYRRWRVAHLLIQALRSTSPSPTQEENHA
ncbi:hypothetical protein BKA60DRAFT_540275 [Fusarium oxysporum]|uniref:Uncharacterized protein n=1 Tax=Fusarium oxysporum TaxID=5507 RepID=A0A420NCF3_FUSOX|nr:hypothetical protein BKA60DRAFT_540275 [Fusarium oxysporum]RKK77953.1 hypothetical protein BFJ69_g5950 [Fusarium oxysporum]